MFSKRFPRTVKYKRSALTESERANCVVVLCYLAYAIFVYLKFFILVLFQVLMFKRVSRVSFNDDVELLMVLPIKSRCSISTTATISTTVKQTGMIIFKNVILHDLYRTCETHVCGGCIARRDFK